PRLWATPPATLTAVRLNARRPNRSIDHMTAKLAMAPMMLNRKVEKVPKIKAVSSVLTAMSQRASRPEKNQRHASTRMLPSPGLAPGIAVANGISDSRIPRATAREANTAMTDSFRTPANSGYDCIRPRLPSGIAGDVHEHPMGQARDRFMEVADA